jgi:hypothetical protein
MKINRENYEIYFIDLIDGTLSNEMVNEVLDFLRENPDLESEIHDLGKLNIHPDNTINYKFGHLLKSDLDQADVFEETCIHSIENELPKNEELDFQIYLSTHPKALRIYRLFKSTRLTPDLSITYKEISTLKRKRKISPIWYAIASIWIIGFVFWLSTTNQPTPDQFVKVTPIHETPSVELDLLELRSTFNQLNEIPLRKTKQSKSIEIPVLKRDMEKIDPLPVSNRLVLAHQSTSVDYTLEAISSSKEKISPYPTVNELLAEKLDKTNSRIEFNNLGKVALNKLKNVTNKKVEYSTNTNGQISKIEFNSKLLAFSFPVKTNQQ